MLILHRCGEYAKLPILHRCFLLPANETKPVKLYVATPTPPSLSPLSLTLSFFFSDGYAAKKIFSYNLQPVFSLNLDQE